jgi:mutual gliding-motility protein MglA
MAFINLKKQEIQCKIVYYGPGRSGKTTNLEYIYDRFRNQIHGEMVTIKTEEDRTLFFDFLPIGLGKIQGFNVRIQLYTVPGQVMYNSTRRLVLKGVDGVVFVADSLVDRRKKNIVSLKNLHENLLSYQKNIFKVPLVLQFNKRDIGQNGIPILSEEIMNNDLNSRLKVKTYLASATQGANVVNTLKSIIKLTVSAVEANILQGEQRVRNS